MSRFRIQFILDRPELSGGVLNVFRVARLLAKQGMEVGISAQGTCPKWLSWRGAWHDHQGLTTVPPAADIYVCTYWTTVRWAAEESLTPRVHFCQGYEGDLAHLEDNKPDIERLYHLPDPIWIVSDMLKDRLSGFDRTCFMIPPVPPEQLSPRFRRGPGSCARILIPGIFEAEVKNIPTALQAVNLLREQGKSIELHRLSTWAQSPEEKRICRADSFHYSLSPKQVARLLPRMDVVLFPSRHMEGFGLPVLEACMAGIPCVMSDIPSLTPFRAAGLPAVHPEDPESFARHAGEMLSSPKRWREERTKVLKAARKFSEDRTRESLRHFFDHTYPGAWPR